MTDKKTWEEYMNSPEAKAISDAFAQQEKQQKEDEDSFWNSLSYEQKQLAFGAVVRRIVQGDIVEKGSYRYVLYNVFGFGPDAYIMGMNCGYMTLHNSIVESENDEQPANSGSGV